MKNAEVIHVLERIADLLELDGADSFRVHSYRKAARSLEGVTEDVAVMAAEGRLTQVEGIGKHTAERIAQFLATGTIDVLTELERKFPPELPGLMAIPGMGPKKVALVHRELNVKNLDDLKRAAASGALEQLAGFGKASVRKIVEGIAFLEKSSGRTPLGIALPIAEALARQVAALEGVQRVEIGGSLRRGEETIGDIDLLCEADAGEAVVQAFTALPEVLRVLAAGETKGSVVVATEEGGEIQVDLRVVPRKSFGAALQYFTGSKAHNVRLREIAVRKKLRLNEYGLFDGEKAVAGETEEGIYRKLGVPFVPPELRQDRGEFDYEEGEVPRLVTLDDVRADLHMHTVASDGRNTIEEMAAAARERGYEYIAICDHSQSSTIANGLSEERMSAHIQAIRRADADLRGITLLVGTECDILPDGRLDYPDELLAECDWVVASIHAAQGPGGSGKLSPTERTLAAMENPHVCAIGHPTGRLIRRRPAMEMDMEKIVTAAARTGTCLEINATWQRLDLKDLHARMAIEAGVLLTINTDAHSTTGLNMMRYGILTARRAGATKKHIANCLTLAALRKRLARSAG